MYDKELFNWLWGSLNLTYDFQNETIDNLKKKRWAMVVLNACHRVGFQKKKKLQLLQCGVRRRNWGVSQLEERSCSVVWWCGNGNVCITRQQQSSRAYNFTFDVGLATELDLAGVWSFWRHDIAGECCTCWCEQTSTFRTGDGNALIAFVRFGCQSQQQQSFRFVAILNRRQGSDR